MSVASDTISQALAQLSSDQRRASTNYLNITARAGNDTTPRRLMSDFGFLRDAQFTYIAAHRANYSVDDTGDQRDIRQIVLYGYGLLSDRRRLTASREANRLVHPAVAGGSAGVSTYPGNEALVMSGGLGPTTASATKQATIIHAATTNTGPAPHFIVNRDGDVTVGPAIDCKTSVFARRSETAIFVALESALVMTRADHAARNYERLLELPFTNKQLIGVAVLVNKLLVALGSSVPRTFSETLAPTDSGFTYVLQDLSSLEGVISPIFKDAPYAPEVPELAFDYTACTGTGFFALVDAQGSYNLATEVWRPFATPPQTAGREQVRGVMNLPDTVGGASVKQGAYITLAMGDRSVEMQTTARRLMFIQRQRATQIQAEAIAGQSTVVNAQLDEAQLLNEEVANVLPHTYDFATGKWGTPDPLTNSPSF